MRTCTFCGTRLREDEGYQQVIGWVRVEKRDGITLREDVYPPRFACRGCIRTRQLGVIQGQESFG